MSHGYIYAATGEGYVTLARKSARSLRRVVPDAQIDLFTDAPLDDAVFDRVHLVEHPTQRPKIEALRRSRFERSIYMDADTVALAPFDDLFGVLDRFDIALCAEQRRNDLRNRTQSPDGDVPAAFPQLNSGLVALRRSAETRAFLDAWHERVHRGDQKFDQLTLRQLLYVSDLRLHVLPPEYNALFLKPFMNLGPAFTAPRMLHSPSLHQRPAGSPDTPFDLSELLTPPQAEKLAELLGADQTIARFVHPGTGTPARPKRHRTGWRTFLGDLRRPFI
ncbi:putative nucleotide-diphospho-sugar transferase [Limimaricola hongkongensis]|uniref:Nucleotide-diphospho-sugar transferase domain-containing protein n=1 Tax=Limimaricola hongkongensis DSM 17492 TaxID=1122180 RepID=A0A017H8M7_9RHOB|nr:putative nucleotide-diphospho-sugar transferase [Limimaricola hongkongensis]EYD70655.1 hypothetical protein Lokhon_02296 [Limimaricola hongkongensis DSM 17492]